MEIYFDGNCPLCRTLAEWARKAGKEKVLIQSWQEFQKTPLAAERHGQDVANSEVDKIRVWDGQVLWEGVEAWEQLISELPQLKGVNWLAERLGLKKVLAKALEKTGHAARLLCSRCPARYARQER